MAHLKTDGVTKKKQSNLGCFIYLGIVIGAFVYVPWPIALGFAIFLAIAIVLVYAIGHEIKKIRRRNRTQKTLISASNKGYTELLARVLPEKEGAKTWLKNEAADYSWVSFQRFVGSRRSDSSGRWVSFFDTESEAKVLKVTDGSADCWVSLHMADMRIKSQIERYEPVELLQALKDKPLAEFPFDELSKKEDIQVVENWIPKDAQVYLFGYLSDLSESTELIAASKKAWRGGDHRNQDRLLSQGDFDSLMKKSQDTSQTRDKIIMTNYEVDPAEGVIISLRGDSVVNRRSYGAIVAFFVGLVVLFAIAIASVYPEFPEFFDQIRRLFSK